MCGQAKAHTFLVEAGSRYVFCRCGLIYQNPLPSPDTLAAYYQDYHPSAEPEILAAEAMMEPVYAEAGRSITRGHPLPGTVLDIGCGFGFFLNRMKDLGWEAVGCDLSRRAAEVARNRFGLRIIVSSFEDFEWSGGAFDAITGFYVIEHVPDPREVLRKIHRLLKPGGRVLLRFPHTAPLVRWGKLFGRHDLFHAPWHLTDFTPAHLRRLMKETGFRDIRFTAGGYTLPEDRLARMVSRISARTFSWLERLNHGGWLMPGMSRNVIASR